MREKLLPALEAQILVYAALSFCACPIVQGWVAPWVSPARDQCSSLRRWGVCTLSDPDTKTGTVLFTLRASADGTRRGRGPAGRRPRVGEKSGLAEQSSGRARLRGGSMEKNRGEARPKTSERQQIQKEVNRQLMAASGPQQVTLLPFEPSMRGQALDACAAELTSRAAQVVEAVSSALDDPGLAALSSVNLATALNRLAKALKARRHLSVFVPPRASCSVRRANTQHAARAMTHPATAGQRGSARGGSAGRPRRGGSGGAGRRRASAGNGGAAAAGAAGV